MSRLGSFLDTTDANVKRSSAATVGGNTPEGEIYIRADGKKVRRVKKVVKGTPSERSLAVEGKSEGKVAEKSRGVSKNSSFMSSSSTDGSSGKNGNLGSFLGSGSAPGTGSKKLGSATVAGDRNIAEDGEIYIRPDGKKVRRVRKGSRSSSGSVGPLAPGGAAGGDSKEAGSAPPEQAPSGTSNASRPKKDLGSFLNRQSGGASESPIASQSVSGRSACGRSARSKDFDVYINKDGKKVRRVKKSSSASVGGEIMMARSTDSACESQSSRMSNRRLNSVSIQGSENKLNRTPSPSKPDSSGKVLSRTPSASKLDEKPALSSGLGGFLESGDRPAQKSKIGSASVAGSAPATQGDVYIRADGKKVRRVRRTTSSSSKVLENGASEGNSQTAQESKQSSLSNFLGAPSASKTKSASATVAVDGRNASGNLSSGASSDEGEIYIRPDGKKVRRVRRSPSTKVSNGGSAGLGSFLASSSSDSASKILDSATVTGATSTPDKKAEEGEVYINKDGKKVRRVRRTGSSTAQSSAGDLAGFLDKPGSVGTSRKSGGASVSGSTPTQDGEIYIRPDGKKVRRVRRSPSGSLTQLHNASSPFSQATTTRKAAGRSDGGRTLSALLDDRPFNNTKNSVADGSESVHEAATVAGDRVIKSSPEGEIVIRADGKKVRRVRKTREGTQEGEVYRRADGKLVRRVRKSTLNSGALADKTSGTINASNDRGQGDSVPVGPLSRLCAEDEKIAEPYRKMLTMGLPDDAVKHKMNQEGVGPVIIESVMNHEVPSAANAATSSGASAHASTLSVEEEAAAGKFRKMLKMGLPEDAVRQKMIAEGLDHKVISAVVGGDIPLPSQQSPAVPVNVPGGLSEEEEVIASRFRKMLKMGLPDDAVKRKMVVEGIDARIIMSVLQGHTRDAPPAASSNVPGITRAGTSALTDEEEAIAGRFRKMLDMGLPNDAVKHKMTSEGVDEKIIASVLSPRPQAPSPQAAPLSSLSGALSAEEEAIAGRFQRMLKMGLPGDAVKHKMETEGVDGRIIKFVLDPAPAPSSQATPPALSPEEEETASRFRKMVKMGLPDDAVKQKMVQDGVSTKIMVAVLGGTTQPPPGVVPAEHQTTPVLSEDEEAAVAQYRKMLKMGMPADAVSHKMAQDGVNQKLVSAVTASPPLQGGTGASSQPQAQAVGAAYVVVVSDDSGPTLPVATAADIKANPGDTFTVSVGGGEGGKGTKKLMSLDEIANATGESRDELEKMVKGKQEKGEASSFVLNHTGGGLQPDGNLFEVEVPVGPGAAGAPATPQDPSKKYSELSDGQEVVDSKLADAARAVSALGDMDMRALLSKLQDGDMEVLMNRLQEAEKRQKKLEKQLAQAGVAIAEDIDYSEAKSKVEEIAKRMGEIGGSDVTVADKEEQNRLREEYFKLEQEMERYNTALMLSEEYQAEQDRLEKKWEDDNAPGNLEAIKKIRRHMPVKIRHMSEADLTNTPSPNGKFLPKAIAKKFKRTNILQCLRLNPDDLERMHPSTLENMRVTGLTLTERRALYYHLKPLGPKWEKNKSEKMTERKWTWYQMMKNNFKENLAPYQRHIDQYGPPENHQGCPLLGKQCPIKADKIIDYDGDYGWTDAAEYEVSDVKKSDADDPGAKAMQEALELAREKKANERADLLKKHYKGKLLQVSKANGSCENMDEAMDRLENHTMRWLEVVIEKGDNMGDADKKKEVAGLTEAINELKLSTLDFAQRSGMQMSGKKKAGGDAEDIRSSVEAGLAEEVFETTQEFFGFVRNRMKEGGTKDTRIEKTMELLEGMLSDLHKKNVELFEKLGVSRPERSRKLKKTEDLKKEVEEKMKPEEEAAPAADEAAPSGPPAGRGGRGGLLGEFNIFFSNFVGLAPHVINVLTFSWLFRCNRRSRSRSR